MVLILRLNSEREMLSLASFPPCRCGRKATVRSAQTPLAARPEGKKLRLRYRYRLNAQLVLVLDEEKNVARIIYLARLAD